MAILTWFIKLMKSEPPKPKKHPWLIDESKCLNEDEILQLRKAANNQREKQRFSLIRNWFMIELGLNAGLRVSEIASLKETDLNIEGDKSSLTIIGKGKKLRSIWISNSFKKTISIYLQYRKQFNFTSEYLLNNLKDGKINKRSLQKAFKQVLEEANLPNHYSIHCLRHTYATFLLKASQYNYRFVQKQLGHASIRTTQVYATVLESEGRRAVEKLYRKEKS